MAYLSHQKEYLFGSCAHESFHAPVQDTRFYLRVQIKQYVFVQLKVINKYHILFDVCKSLHHHTIQINQTTKCNNSTSLLLDVYVWLNMFREPLRPSSGAYNCTRSLWFYRWRVAVGALLVVVCQTTTNNAATKTGGFMCFQSLYLKIYFNLFGFVVSCRTSDVNTSTSCESHRKNQQDATVQKNLLFQCLLIARHVSGDTPPIIRSSKTVTAASGFT